MIRLVGRLTLLALCLTFHPASLHALPRNLDRYVEDARKEWGVVGLAVAVVKDGQVVYAKGFGERKLGGSESVDENTLFAIGSNTNNWHYDTFLVRWRDPVMRKTLVTFRLSPEGTVEALDVQDVETFEAVAPIAPIAK